MDVRAKMENEDKRKPIKVFARVRPLNDEEVERGEKISVETFEDTRKIKIIDEKHSQETTYYFDGVFSGEDPNEIVFQNTTRHLLTKLLNGMNCAVLTYGQTGSGKTFTLMADGCITEYAMKELYEKIEADKIHKYKIYCSFVQVYLEKVYDLLGDDNRYELPVREHPKKGVYVSNLSHHQARTADEVFMLLEKGKQELVTAETKMVRQSSRSHSIFQLCIERRLDISKKKLFIANGDDTNATSPSTEVPHLCVPDDIIVLEEDVVLSGKMDICDLAGSERLGKTMVEGINRSEARHINSSLLELGNVIYALSEGKKRHIPFRNSTLTRLLQECLGSRCQTSFIVCIAPSASEAYETRCSLNFGTRARTITNKERMSMNVEIDYKLLAKKLSRKIELLENELNVSRPIRNFISSSLQSLCNSVAIQTNPLQMRPNELNDMTSVQCIAFIHHSLKLSEMLESLIENIETSEDHTEILDVSKSPMQKILNTATEQFNNIYMALIHTQYHTSIDISNFIGNLSEKIFDFKKELEQVTSFDKKDLLAETSYIISEGCCDLENLILHILQNRLTNKENKQFVNRDEINEKDNRHAVVGDMLKTLIANDMYKENEQELTCIYHLINALGILQITRLLMESSKFIMHTRELSSDNSKPYICSSSVEELTTSDVGFTSNEDPYFSDMSRIDPANDMNFLRPEYYEERVNQSLQVKLNRNKSFKIKTNLPWFHNKQSINIQSPTSFLNGTESDTKYTPLLSQGRSEIYPKTPTKRFILLEDEDSSNSAKNIGEEQYQLKSEAFELGKCHDELSNMYINAFHKKECLNEKTTMSRVKEDSILRELTESESENRDDKTTLNHYKGNNEINEKYELLLEEKDEEIIQLQSENQRLLTLLENEQKTNVFKEENDEALVEEINKDEIDVTDVIDELFLLCNDLDLLAYQNSVRKSVSNIEDINQLESELFNMIEKNVKYEESLNQFRTKLTGILHKGEVTGSERDILPQQSVLKISNAKVISSKISSKVPNHVTKKILGLKKIQRKRLEELRKAYSQQPVSMAKEIKACRASRVKELAHEKLTLNDQLERLEKTITEKDIELRERKKQIDLLIAELGHLDIELNRKQKISISREKTSLDINNVSKKNNSRSSVGDNEYMKMSYTENQHVTKAGCSNNKEEFVPVSELESIKLEAESYRLKYRDLEQLYQDTKNNIEEKHLLKQNLQLKRKVEYLEETNATLLNEIKTFKSTNQDRKLKIQELRDRNNSLIEELEYYKRQTVQAQAKNDNTKIKLEKRISKFKEKVSTLENRSQKLQSEINTLVKSKTFNDSGLANSVDSD